METSKSDLSCETLFSPTTFRMFHIPKMENVVSDGMGVVQGHSLVI